METEFKDRGGKIIYLGDLVQYRLSMLNNGPSILRVAKGKRSRIVLVDPRSTTGQGGLPIDKHLEKYLSIIDTSGREHS